MLNGCELSVKNYNSRWLITPKMLCHTNDGMAFYMACNVMPKLSKMLVAIKSFENLNLHHGKKCYVLNTKLGK
jgi:hypothetical protein